MSTPNTNLQTYWHKGISHVMSVTIFFICLTSAISAYSAAQNFSLTSCTETMAKRVQEQEGEDRIVAKSKPTTMNLAFIVSTGSSAVQNLVASQSSGILKALCRKDWLYTGKPDAREFNRDAASSSQCTRRLVAPEEDQQHLNFPEESKSTRRLLASGSSETKGRERKIGHTITINQQTTCRTWRRFSRFWDKDMVSVRWIKWRISMWTRPYGVYFCLPLRKLQFILVQTLRRICDLPGINPRSHWDSCFNWLRSWSLTKLKLLGLQRLIGSSPCGERRLCWLTELFSLQLQKPTSFLTQCFVWEVSVLNQSKHGKVWLNGSWKHFLKRIGSDRWRTDGIRVENITRIHNVGNIAELNCEPEHFKGRIIFMSMFNDIDRWKRGNRENCIANAHRFTEYARRFSRGHWSFLAPGSEKRRRNGTELISANLMDNGRKLLRIWCSTLPKADILCSVLPAH